MLTGLTRVSTQARAAIYDRSLAESNLDRQAMHLGEEVGELLIAVSHLIRGRAQDKANFLEEVADVMVMLEEFTHYFGVAPADIAKAVDAKLAKYARNLKFEAGVRAIHAKQEQERRPTVEFGKAPGPECGCWHRYAEAPVGPKGCVCDNTPHRPEIDCEIAAADGYIQTRTDCKWFGGLNQVVTNTKMDPRTRLPLPTPAPHETDGDDTDISQPAHI